MKTALIIFTTVWTMTMLFLLGVALWNHGGDTGIIAVLFGFPASLFLALFWYAWWDVTH